MTYTYSLLPNTTAVLRNDGAVIPPDPLNADWQAYQAWLSVGNVVTPVPAPTLAQQALTMLATGCQIASTSTPTLNGTYALDPVSQGMVQAEVVSLLLNSVFTNGTTTLDYPYKSGTPHAFSVTEFKAFATALAQFVTTLTNIAASNSGTLPPQPTTIA
jgi:hypothetical protein